MNKSTILEVRHVCKTFSLAEKTISVLEDVSFQLLEGATCAIAGPSGSGKTTLLGLCAGLDRPSSGLVVLGGTDLSKLKEDERARLRRNEVGFVFQTFRLLPTLTALENVMVPLELQGEKDAGPKAGALLDRVGLKDRLRHYPAQLSGGEQQRVALARAFIHKPRILFADEPTGNLDTETGQRVAELLFELNREAGTTLVLVTHDRVLADKTDTVLQLRGGRLQPGPGA